MSRPSLIAAMTLLLLTAPAHAQQSDTAPPSESIQAPAEQNAVATDLQATIAELNARLTELDLENRELHERLKQAQQAQPKPLLDEQQRWFLLGATVAVLSFIAGVLYSRGQRRRQWLN